MLVQDTLRGQDGGWGEWIHRILSLVVSGAWCSARACFVPPSVRA